MDNSLKNLLNMVNCTMYGREFECEGDCDWKVIYTVCNKSGLTPFLLPVVQKAGSADIPEELAGAWTKLSLKAGMKQTVANLELGSLLSGAEKAGLNFTVFKGVVLASLYPQMELRCSCDADILINENERQKTADFLTERGYVYLEGASKNNVMVFILAGKLKLEIHTRLWEDYEGFRMNALKDMRLDDESAKLHMTLGGMRVTTLGYTQQLIYMIYHNAKHLSLEGMGLRPMVDITYFINAYLKNIDIDDFWMAMRKLDYIDFAKASFILCQRYLGMTRFVEDDGGDAADVLLEDLLAIDGTAPGNNSWQLLGLLEPYLSGDRRLPRNKAIMRLKLIFPKCDALPARYAYAKKHRLLLPAAWVHRFLHNMSERRKHKGVLEAQDKVKKAVERLEIMKKLGLVK